jgi:hypothetical protein
MKAQLNLLVGNDVRRMASSGMFRRVALVRTDVSEELSAPSIRVPRIGDRFLSPSWWRRYVPPKRRLLQEPHGITSQKTPFFKVTAVKTSNLTKTWESEFRIRAWRVDSHRLSLSRNEIWNLLKGIYNKSASEIFLPKTNSTDFHRGLLDR